MLLEDFFAEALFLKAGAEPGHEQGRADRAGKKILGSVLDAAHRILLLLQAGHDDDGGVAQLTGLTQSREHREAIHLRHADVEEDGVEVPVLHLRDRLDPVFGEGEVEAARLEETPEDLAVFRIVVGDEEGAGFARREGGRGFRDLHGGNRVSAGEGLEAAVEEGDGLFKGASEGCGDASEPNQLGKSEEVIEPIAAVVPVTPHRLARIFPVEGGHLVAEEGDFAREFLEITRQGRSRRRLGRLHPREQGREGRRRFAERSKPVCRSVGVHVLRVSPFPRGVATQKARLIRVRAASGSRPSRNRRRSPGNLRRRQGSRFSGKSRSRRHCGGSPAARGSARPSP